MRAPHLLPAQIVPVLAPQPDDFVAKVIPPKDRVHCHPNVSVGAVVAVQVDAARRPEDAVAFQQPHRQKAEECGDAVVVSQPCRLNRSGQSVVAGGIAPGGGALLRLGNLAQSLDFL